VKHQSTNLWKVSQNIGIISGDVRLFVRCVISATERAFRCFYAYVIYYKYALDKPKVFLCFKRGYDPIKGSGIMHIVAKNSRSKGGGIFSFIVVPEIYNNS
jgi:hypothetical protein